MASKQFIHQRGPSEWTLFVPEDSMPGIMRGMRDTQAIHTKAGARALGLPASLLPGAFLSAHARYVADVFHEEVGGVEGSAQLGQRTRFAHPGFADREVYLTVEAAKGGYKVVAEMRVGDKERKVFQSTIRRGEPDLEATVDIPEPIRSYDVAEGQSVMMAREVFYDRLGTPGAMAGDYRDAEDLSRTLAYAVPPMLQHKARLVAEGELADDFTIASHSIDAVRNYRLCEIPRPDGGDHLFPAHTERVDLVRADVAPLKAGKRGSFELLAWNGGGMPSYRIQFTLSPAKK